MLHQKVMVGNKFSKIDIVINCVGGSVPAPLKQAMLCEEWFNLVIFEL